MSQMESSRMDQSGMTDVSMDITGLQHRTQPLEAFLQEDSPAVMPDFTSKTFKRRSTNMNVRKSIQLLDEAVSSPHSTSMRSSLLRKSAYVPHSSFTTPSHDRSLNQSSRERESFKTSFLSQSSHLPDSSMVDVTTTNVALLLEEDVGLSASVGVYEDFMQSLKRNPAQHQVFDLILDFENICADQSTLLRKLLNRITAGQEKFKKTYEVKNLLDDEKATWQLIRSLYKDRLETEIQSGVDTENDMIVDDMAVFHSDKDIVNKLYEKNSSVRQSQLVVDWLESCAQERMDEVSDVFVVFADKPVAWENTLHQLLNKKSSIPTGTDRPLVEEIDPDAPIRENRLLDDLDQEDEERLLQYMLVCIRSGQLDKCQDVCMKYGQAWRAATLEGWRLYHDPNYEGLGPEGQVLPIEGNPYRDIWKTVCWRMSQDPKISIYEKAVYAVLSGNLKSILPVCKTWADYLWAYMKVFIDTMVEKEIRMKTKLARSLETLPDEFWSKRLNVSSIFQDIEACPQECIRNEAKAEFHVIQKHIIAGDIQGLVEVMHSWTKRDKSRLPMHLLRFLAHLVLFLRSIGQSTKENLCDAVLEKYVDYLILNNHKQQVAHYVAKLPQEAQIVWYAKFLEGIHEKDERQNCLQLAEEAGLDIPLITKTVVENIRKRDSGDVDMETLSAETDISPLVGLVELFHSQSGRGWHSIQHSYMTKEDRQKIESIDWLVFDQAQRAEALKQANAVMRGFIALKKYVAAGEVFKKLPQDTVDTIYRIWSRQTGSADLPAADENAVREYMCIKAILDAQQSFNDWFNLYHHSKPAKPSVSVGATFTDKVAYEHRMKQYESELDRWQHTLLSQTQITKDHIYNVLLFADGGWMIDQRIEEEPDESRKHQIKLLREINIPSMFFLLHKVLHSTGQFTECIEIADCVASDMHHLYKVFKKEDLQHLLKLVHDSSLALLDHNKDPLGYELV